MTGWAAALPGSAGREMPAAGRLRRFYACPKGPVGRARQRHNGNAGPDFRAEPDFGPARRSGGEQLLQGLFGLEHAIAARQLAIELEQRLVRADQPVGRDIAGELEELLVV